MVYKNRNQRKPNLMRDLISEISSNRDKFVAKNEAMENERGELAALQKEADMQAAVNTPPPARITDNPLVMQGRVPQSLGDLANFSEQTSSMKMAPSTGNPTGIDWDKVSESNPNQTKNEPLPVTFVSAEEDQAKAEAKEEADFAERAANPEVTTQYGRHATDVPLPPQEADPEEEGTLDEVPDEMAAEVEDEKESLPPVLDENQYEPGATDVPKPVDMQDVQDIVSGDMLGLDDTNAMNDTADNTELGTLPGEEMEEPDAGVEAELDTEEETPIPSRTYDPGSVNYQRRRNNVINDAYMPRIGKDVMQNGITRDKLKEVYDKAYMAEINRGADDNEAHSAGLQTMYLEGQDYFSDRQIQREVNFRNQQDQRIRARRTGLPEGMFMSLDLFHQAQTPQEALMALADGAAMYPNGPFQSIMRGLNDGFGTLSEMQVMSQMLLNDKLRDGDGETKEPLDETKSPIQLNLQMHKAAVEKGMDNGWTEWSQYAQQKGLVDPGERRMEYATDFSSELQTIKMDIMAGETNLSPKGFNIIRSLLGGDASEESLIQMFGPLSEEEVEKLQRAFTGMGTRTYQQWIQGIGEAIMPQ